LQGNIALFRCRWSEEYFKSLFLEMPYNEAADIFIKDLSDVFLHNLEAPVEALSLLHQFFPLGWSKLPENMVLRRISWVRASAVPS
ncbi:hypothetical protein, partial [Chlorobaculum thiosulfatiphilum]|uniref:hypothetical protein n=1 Tax=Chlorobaculum thiosulfatiphilum TaxID=115852 RepID=UPI0014770744